MICCHNAFAEWGEVGNANLDRLDAERNTDNCQHHGESAKDVAKAGNESAKDEPDNVSEKCHRFIFPEKSCHPPLRNHADKGFFPLTQRNGVQTIACKEVDNTDSSPIRPNAGRPQSGPASDGA